MSEQSNSYVELKGINKTYNEYKASDDVNFSIEQGKLIALLGPSGSGKTTILRMIAGLEYADSGEIIIDGTVVNDIPASKRGIGFVFQNYALFRYKTVYDNIAFGLKVNKWSKEAIKERVDELITLVGLQGLEKRYPNQLSGGQRQRVAFARALAPNPELLLLDEPFAAIDAKVRQELRNWLREMIDKLGITSIFVTHDQEEAIEVADEIIITNKGRIEQIGTPNEIYKEPKTPFVAEFMGQPIRIENINKFKGFTHLEDGRHAVIRPENVSITKRSEHFAYPVSVESGTVERILFRGKELELSVRIHDILIKGNRRIEDAPIVKGETVNVCIYRAYTFREESEITIVGNSHIGVTIVGNANIETEESVVI
jgi:sulfate transport system ATP-binding protein